MAEFLDSTETFWDVENTARPGGKHCVLNTVNLGKLSWTATHDAMPNFFCIWQGQMRSIELSVDIYVSA